MQRVISGLILLFVGLALAGCVYNDRSERGPERVAAAEPRMPPPERVRSEDLARLEPSVGRRDSELGPPPPTPPPRATPTPRRYFVQAASFSTRAQAERVRRALAGLGPVSIYTAFLDDRTRYRVRIGPLATAERSERVRRDLARRGYRGAIVVHE